jgi:hypothetical protein
MVAWTAETGAANDRYLGVFNVNDRPGTIRVDWGALKLPDSCLLRDLWEKKNIGTIATGYSFRLAPHAAGMYRVTVSK